MRSIANDLIAPIFLLDAPTRRTTRECRPRLNACVFQYDGLRMTAARVVRRWWIACRDRRLKRMADSIRVRAGDNGNRLDVAMQTRMYVARCRHEHRAFPQIKVAKHAARKTFHLAGVDKSGGPINSSGPINYFRAASGSRSCGRPPGRVLYPRATRSSGRDPVTVPMGSITHDLILIVFVFNTPLRCPTCECRPSLDTGIFQQNRRRPIVLRRRRNDGVFSGNGVEECATQALRISNKDNCNGIDVHVGARLQLYHGRHVDDGISQVAVVERSKAGADAAIYKTSYRG
jgi:hypothetical protein